MNKQLLELAAKAAEIEIKKTPSGTLLARFGVTEWVEWNPIEDDGDALRLAVKLGMEVYVDTHPEGCSCTEAQSITYSTPENAGRSIINHNNDPYAATRLAIVRAAAEIGKNMEVTK